MPEIRRANLDDHAQIQKLWAGAGWGRMDEPEWNVIISSPTVYVFVAEENERLAGVTIASFEGWRAYVYRVAVAPEHQHRGLAKALMAEAEAHVAREGARYIYVMVAEENTGGLALVEAMGYRPEGSVVYIKEPGAGT